MIPDKVWLILDAEEKRYWGTDGWQKGPGEAVIYVSEAEAVAAAREVGQRCKVYSYLKRLGCSSS